MAEPFYLKCEACGGKLKTIPEIVVLEWQCENCEQAYGINEMNERYAIALGTAVDALEEYEALGDWDGAAARQALAAIKGPQKEAKE